jgi:hypothetical protein
MSIALATKGIISVSAPQSVLIDPIPVCEPDVASYEYGEKHMKGRELKPVVKTERRVIYKKKYLE